MFKIYNKQWLRKYRSVILDEDNKSLLTFSSSARELVQKAREYQDLVLLVTSNEDFTEQDT